MGIAVKRHADAGGRGTYGYILNVDVDIYSAWRAKIALRQL